MQNRVYVAVLYHRDTPIEVHKFTMEPDGKPNYNANLSWEYFCDRENTKVENKVPYVWRISGMRQEDWDWHIKMREQTGKPEEPVKEFEHDSIWGMYEAAGYCYKRKRYVRQE